MIFTEVIKKDDIDFYTARIIDRYREVAGQIVRLMKDI